MLGDKPRAGRVSRGYFRHGGGTGEFVFRDKEDGEKGEWWLRTPELRSISTVMGVTMNGEGAGCGICGLSSYYKLGVRPAFCLPRDTSIIEVDGLYYIEADYNSLDVMNNAEDRRALLYEDILTPRQTNNAKPISNEYHKEEYNEYTQKLNDKIDKTV